MIRFQPWVPDGDPRFRGIRLLVLGESHYEEGPDWIDDGRPLPSDYTIEMVRNHGMAPNRRIPFTAGVFSALTGEAWRLDHPALESFWNDVLVYNYVQKLVPEGARRAPSSTAWAFSHPLFREALEQTRPDAVIATGRRLWKSMTDEDVVMRPSPDPMAVIAGYRLQDGTLIPALHIRHPSSNGFNWTAAHTQIEGFLAWLVTPAAPAGAPDRA